jgi:predicted Zn finger-like uncharacterized protein
MIVTCSNCQTRFNLPDEKIPDSGAKVKCSKCAHVFKVDPPAPTLEDEVENLLDEEAPASDTQAGDKFDETFDEVAAGDQAEAEPDEPADKPVSEPEASEPVIEEVADAPAEESIVEEAVEDSTDESIGDLFADEDEVSADVAEMDDLFDEVSDAAADDPEEGSAEVADEDMPGMDDLFDDTDEAPEVEEGSSPVGGDEGTGSVADDVESLFGDDDEEDDPFADVDEASSEDDLFGDADGDNSTDDELFDDDEDESDDESFAGGTDFGLDKEQEKKKSSKAVPILIVLLMLILGIGAAVYFKAWTLVGLDTESLKNLPVIGNMLMEETGGDAEIAPGESPEDRVRKIELRNVKQYYVANEKTGNLFVVEGKAVNKFDAPKEQIKVEVVLYDGTGNVLTSQSFLCGNQLSQFQLQVQTQKEVEDGLSSEVGILSNNTFVRPGNSVPFMAVFFQPPAGVKEFLVKVVDVVDAK